MSNANDIQLMRFSQLEYFREVCMILVGLDCWNEGFICPEIQDYRCLVADINGKQGIPSWLEQGIDACALILYLLFDLDHILLFI